jgi:hypothetical protein
MNIQHKIYRFGLLASILLTAILFAGTASAVIIVDQQPTPNSDYMYDAYFSSVDFGTLNADEFVANDNYRIDTITWWGLYDVGVTTPGSFADNFTVQLFSEDATGNPAINTLYDFDTSAVARAAVAGTDIFSYSLDVSSTGALLDAGSQYYLSVMNDNLDSDWYWVLNDNISENWFRTTYDEAWVPGSEIGFMGDMAMKIEGTTVVAVPEPETLSLFLLPLIYLVGTKLKSKYVA